RRRRLAERPARGAASAAPGGSVARTAPGGGGCVLGVRVQQPPDQRIGPVRREIGLNSQNIRYRRRRQSPDSTPRELVGLRGETADHTRRAADRPLDGRRRLAERLLRTARRL